MCTHYKCDPKLPYRPNKYYSDEWVGWREFLGTSKRSDELYKTLNDASEAAKNIGITTKVQYECLYKTDPRLPAEPLRYYSDEWNGWWDFLGTKNPRDYFYSTLKEAGVAARKMGITSQSQYRKTYKRDIGLPPNPHQHYVGEWLGWREFLGTTRRDKFYHTFAEACDAARGLGITSSNQYKSLYKLDARLPSYPGKIYSDEWDGWSGFLGKKRRGEIFYPTLIEASVAVRKLGINSRINYSRNYKRDARLPSEPSKFYINEWNGWSEFLGTKRSSDYFYPTLSEASEAAIKLGICSSSEYSRQYKTDVRLPSDPKARYRREWLGWRTFLLPKNHNCLNAVRQAVKILNIKNSTEYKKIYKKYSCLPAHPERVFKDEWVSWYELCGIPTPYKYEEARKIVNSHRIASQVEYLRYKALSKDSRLPRAPEQVYVNEWINWYVFLGREEPFRLKYLRSPYEQWKKEIDVFLKTARGGGTKESYLVRFLRLYVHNHCNSKSPEEFLTRKKFSSHGFLLWLDTLKPSSVRNSIVTTVKEFFDHIIKTKLSEEDENSGALVISEGVRNPFDSLIVNYFEPRKKLGETNKPALAYQYIESARSWIMPEEAKTYSDLHHLHQYDADWVEVSEDLLDKSDRDCIYKFEHGKVKIWFPVYWTMTYALLSIPGRGKQIAYCDSGEGDESIPDIQGGKIVWTKNDGPLANSTKCQSMIKRYPDNQFGIHYTTNKTQFYGVGYDVAWIPINLVYWLIRLRKWQQKYNTIFRAMPWLECHRTNLNEVQRKSKGSNCFLFRDINDEEPGHHSGRLASRLSAAIYYSQPADLVLATNEGDLKSLSHYESIYTPHSMRVSLITAFIEELGLPLEFVMKLSGHSSVVMTIYYNKSNAENMRVRFEEGEKKALKNQSYAAQRLIEQGRIESIKSELIANAEDALAALSNNNLAGTYLFRDYGFCPFAGTRCDDGGPEVGKTRVRSQVSAGYLGYQNCVRCRHFVTGPSFLGGLLSLGNEISLHSHNQFQHYDRLELKSKKIKKRIDELDDAAYDADVNGSSFDGGGRNRLAVERRKAQSEAESAAKKLDMLMCDIQAVSRLIKQCQALVNKQVSDDSQNNTQLIVQSGHELHFALEDTSEFRQVCEVCENAEIYESAKADLAVAPRTQMLDRMALRNNMTISLFTLDQDQQLVIGNQVSRLLLKRLKTWERVDGLIEGRISLQDLSDNERMIRRDLDSLMTPLLKSAQEFD